MADFCFGAIQMLVIYFVSALGVGIGAIAAYFTFKHTSLSKKRNVTDGERQDALERLKVWIDFWKYFLVSFALVLITSLLGNALKERELEMQDLKQKADLALETAKASSESLIAENTNLGSFLDRALSEDWRKQYAFASYFSHLTRDPDAQARWKSYAQFIVDTKKEAAVSEERARQLISKIAAARKTVPPDPQLPALEKELMELQATLDLKQAVLQPETSAASRYQASKQRISNRGAPPDSFLDELVAWGKAAPDEIFAPDNPDGSDDANGIYTGVKTQLGPWQSPSQRRAGMLEVMRVLAGFESSWSWNEGFDLTSPSSSIGGHNNQEAGAWQVTASSMNFGAELKSLVLAKVGTLDPSEFQRAMKTDHAFAMEYAARLLRRTTRYFGPLQRHDVDPWLRRDAMNEFQSLIETKQGAAPPDPSASLPSSQ